MVNAITAAFLLAAIVLYLAGARRLRNSAGGRQTIPWWRGVAFLLGCASVVLALLSRLDRWSDVLFSVHMVQHEILMLVSAPLMVLGRPFVVTLWALPRSTRDATARLIKRPAMTQAWRSISGPFTVLVLHALVLWVWHLPLLFEAALHDDALHAFQHLGFFLTAALFWWALIHGRYGRLGYGIAVFFVFATALHTTLLGVLITYAKTGRCSATAEASPPSPTGSVRSTAASSRNASSAPK